MRFSFFLSLVFCFWTSFSGLAGQPKLVLKYSMQDCLFCNAQVVSLEHLSQSIPTLVWMKESKRNDSDLEDLLSRMRKNGMTVLFSDSAYYSVDSTERSKVYVLDEGRLLFTSYLKELDGEALPRFFDPVSKRGLVAVQSLYSTKVFGSHIYMLDGGARILRVSKDKLDVVEDTFSIKQQELKSILYRQLSGGADVDQLISRQTQLQEMGVPTRITISDFEVTGDTLMLGMSVPFLDSTSQRGQFVRYQPFIAMYVHSKLERVWTVDAALHTSGIYKKYIISASKIAYYRGAFIMTANTATLLPDARIYALTKTAHARLEFAGFAEYALPDYLVKSRIGYTMADLMRGGPYISNVYSSVIYLIDKNKYFDLNFAHAENSFSEQAVKDLHFEMAFQIVDLYGDKERLSVLYKNGDALEYVKYTRAGDSFALVKHAVVAGHYPTREFYYNSNGIACDENGFYTLSDNKHRFNFVPYP